MVKTRSDLKGIRVSAKAPRKAPPSSSCNSPGGRSRKYEGGNSYCPRETPPWQKEITRFFPSKPSSDGASSSKSDVDNGNVNPEIIDESEQNT